MTEARIMSNGKLRIDHVSGKEIKFRHFSGERDKYHAQGARDFNIEVSDEFAEELIVNGWRVKAGKDVLDPETGENKHYGPMLKVIVKYHDNGNGTSTVTWGSNTQTVNGSVSFGNFKYEWTEANALYNVAPPTATFENDAVQWDLTDVGTLLNGVTYTVTFNCWPSQTTLDLIADLKNNPDLYDELDDSITQYLVRGGNEGAYSYTLYTNTTTSLSYTDTRPDGYGSGTTTFNRIEPVSTRATELLSVAKEWENELYSHTATDIKLIVTRDDAPQYDVTLGSPSWSDQVFISVGILSLVDANGNAITDLSTVTDPTKVNTIMRTTGHDYTFAEPDNVAYY